MPCTQATDTAQAAQASTASRQLLWGVLIADLVTALCFLQGDTDNAWFTALHVQAAAALMTFAWTITLSCDKSRFPLWVWLCAIPHLILSLVYLAGIVIVVFVLIPCYLITGTPIC